MKTVLSGIMALAFVLSAVSAYAQAVVVGKEAAEVKAEVLTAVPDVTVADLKKAIADKAVVLIDCNGSESFAKGRLPGAIDFEAAKADLAKVLPADKAALIVAYCGGPKCLAYKAGVKALEKLGYTNVKHFSGGLAGWKEAGEALEAK